MNNQLGNNMQTQSWSKFISVIFSLVFLSILIFAGSVSPVHADGSVDMTNSGGYRPYLEYRTDLNAGILRRTTIYVYAMPTESILLGSSATGIGAGNITYVRPDGTTGSCVAGVGLIANRAQEVAGPYGAGGFTPCVVVVGAAQGGVWQINFLSPNQASATNPPPLLATAAWAQPNNVGYVTAWDVTVRTAGSVVMPGRTYANYLSLNMGGNAISLSSLIYVQTSDGYRYRVDMNSMDPFGFIFFSSPKGLVDSGTGDPLYHSVDLEGPNPGSLPAGVTIDVSGTATHKIFFKTPDYTNLPASAPISGGTTWLDVPTFTPPPPTNFAFTGAEGTPGQGGTNPLGGYFSFDTTLDGSFSIWLDINQDGIYGNANDRQLFDYASIGTNQIFWDGLDGTGAVVPASSQAYNARITLNAGEIHFPFIDVENNPTGFVIVREIPNTSPPDPSLLYWDDRTVTQEGGNVPPVPLYSLAGTPSSGGAHGFASNFGDREAIENWTYLPTTPVLMAGGVQLLQADLEVVKTHSPANPVAGQPYNYTIVVTNNGPSDETGITFADTLPAVMISPSWTCAVTSGTGSCSAPSGTGSSINLNLDMNNGAVITINVSGTLSPSAVPPITNTATVTRSLDVTDPNLVNNTSTDTFSLTTGFSLTKVADVASVDAAGDVINYTITITNTGTQSLTNVTIADLLLANQVCTPPEPATLAPTAVMVCTGDHTVTQAEMDAGLPINNTVTGSTNESPDQTASETVTITQTPGLSIVKSVLEANYSLVGTVLHYSYLVTNSGNVTLTGPFTVTDDQSIDEACPATATLAPLASITCTATYTITLADLNAGSVTNIASAHGFFASNPVNSPTDSETVTAFIGADLWLEKTVTTLTPDFRSNVTFTLTIHNDGPSNASNVTVQDILPAGLAYQSDDGGGAYAGGIWTVGNLAAGGSASLQITVYVDTPLPVTNYTQIWTSDLPDPDSTPGDTSITQDDDAAVTLTPQFSRLIVDKTMIGGVADFVFTGTPNGTINTDGGILDLIVPPGTYTSTEIPTVGWTLQSIVCNDANSTGNVLTGVATFNAEAFETVTCFFTNELTAVPALSIVKSVTETAYVAVGDVLHYSYLVTNTGNVTLSGPFTVTDDRSTDETCPATATLAPLASITCTATYTVTQADLDAGTVTNIASAHGIFNGNPVDSATDSETVPATQNPALTIVKSVTETAYVAVGDILHYSYLVTNTGNVTLSGPFTVTDDRSTDETCPATATLAPLASITCTATYTVTQADLDAGTVTNIASAHGIFNGNPIDSATDSETVPATQNPALTIVKSVTETAYVAVGDILHYSYLVTNTGNVTLSGPFTVTDDRSTDEACPATATLAPLASITCTATYTITQADLDAGDVTNIASAHGTFGGNPVDSTTDSETVDADQNPELTIVKSASPATYDAVGDVISYSYLVTNTGNVTLSGPFTVTDDRSTDEACPATATLAPLASITCTATYTITQADLDAGDVTNIASAHGTFGGNPVDSTTDSETVNADQNPELTIVKTASPATYDSVGDVISYSYLVTNTGNVTLSGPFTVTDDRSTDEACPVTATLAPLASITCTATYTVTQADLDAGSVTNIASAHGTFGGNPVNSTTDSETVNADQNPELTIVKSVTETTYVAVGDILHYSYLVTNTGNVTLTGPFTVTDDRSTDETCPATATLAPLASITCTATYTVTQADLDAGV